MNIEPFGYFRAEPFGWTDCDKGDEGAVPLYERAVLQQLETERASLFAESQRKQQLERQVGELVGVLEAMLEEVAGCYCATESAARAIIQKVRGGAIPAESMGRPIVWAAIGKDAGPC